MRNEGLDGGGFVWSLILSSSSELPGRAQDAPVCSTVSS